MKNDIVAVYRRVEFNYSHDEVKDRIKMLLDTGCVDPVLLLLRTRGIYEYLYKN